VDRHGFRDLRQVDGPAKVGLEEIFLREQKFSCVSGQVIAIFTQTSWLHDFPACRLSTVSLRPSLLPSFKGCYPFFIFLEPLEGLVIRQFPTPGLDRKIGLAIGNDRLGWVSVLDNADFSA